MAYSRFFLTRPLDTEDPQVASLLPMADDDVHHAVSVLRITESEKIAVVDPSGVAHLVEVAEVSRSGIVGRVVGTLDPVVEPRVSLIQGVSKGERMELCIRMSVEVGVCEVVPVLTARSIVKLEERKRSERGERWRRIARAAAKQSGRMRVPEVRDPEPLSNIGPRLNDYDLVLVAWEETDRGSLREIVEDASLTSDARVAVVVGPEGGLTAAEVEALVAAGAVPFTLGDTILRTETAGVVASALLVYEMGGLGRSAK